MFDTLLDSIPTDKLDYHRHHRLHRLQCSNLRQDEDYALLADR